MKCKNCGKQIDDNEIFCSECKNKMRYSSSGEEVNELEKLIQDQEEINKLEDTIELVNLESLENEDIDKDLDETTSITREEYKKEMELKSKEKINDNDNLDNSKKNKKKKNKIIIIISILSILLITTVITLMLVLSKGQSSKKEVIDYKEILKEYGKLLEKNASEYISLNETVPTWSKLTTLTNYEKYKIVCDNHNIYNDGNIYLSSCKVNGKKIEYSYGKEYIEVPKGLVGLSEKTACDKIKKAKLVCNVIYEYNNLYKEDVVMEVEPDENTKLKENSQVTIKVSSYEDTIEIEDYTGKNIETVKAQLELKGIKVITVEKKVTKSDNIKENTIIAQSIKKGTRLEKNDVIELTYAIIITVYPDFTDGSYTRDLIEQFCEDNGIKCIFKEIFDDKAHPGDILFQSRNIGDEVIKGTTLTITIASNEQIDSET